LGTDLTSVKLLFSGVNEVNVISHLSSCKIINRYGLQIQSQTVCLYVKENFKCLISVVHEVRGTRYLIQNFGELSAV
jgi:hypothetical protein